MPPRTALLAGIAGAAILDADKPCEYFFGFNPWPHWLDEFHKRIQHESPEGIRIEIATGVALTAVERGGARATPARVPTALSGSSRSAR